MKFSMNAEQKSSGVPMMSDLGADFISGAVSLARLLTIYGHEYVEEVDALWATPGTDFIVLFADDEEREYALLPVGPAHLHKSLDKALLMDFDGLHAVCHSAAGDGIKPVSLTIPEEGWKRLKRIFPEEAKEVESLIAKASSSEQVVISVLEGLAEKTKALQSREDRLLEREKHVMASAKRVEELMRNYGKWEDLKAHAALLEQREKYVHEVELQLIRRTQEMEVRQEEITQANVVLEVKTAAYEATRAPFPK